MSGTTSTRRPAELLLRAGAYMIDGLIVGLCRLILRGAGAPWEVPFVFAAAYYTWMPVAYGGQTFGKMAAGVALEDVKGGPVTYGQCLGRYFGYFLSAALLGAGYLVAFFHLERRALHDILAGTRVAQAAPVGGWRRAAVLVLGASSLLALPLLALAALMLSRRG